MNRKYFIGDEEYAWCGRCNNEYSPESGDECPHCGYPKIDDDLKNFRNTLKDVLVFLETLKDGTEVGYEFVEYANIGYDRNMWPVPVGRAINDIRRVLDEATN